MFYSVFVDGKKIVRKENENPMSHKNVFVFAGRDYQDCSWCSGTAANATYRNLVWENLGK